MNFPFFYRHPVIGIDIQPQAIHMLQLKSIKRGFLLERATSFATPAHIFSEDKIKQWETLCSFLTDIVLGLNIKGMRVALNLPINQVRLQKIKLPSGLTQLAIQTEIYNHIENDLPGMKEALCMDFYLIQQTSTFIELVYVVARREYLQKLIQCINATGLKVHIVDVDIFALKRVLDYLLPNQDNKINAIVQISEAAILFFVHNAKEIILHARWVNTNNLNIALLIKNQLQVNQLDNHVNKLVICAGRNRYQTLVNEFTSLFTIETIYNFSIPQIKIMTNNLVDSNQLQENLSDYLLAFGSALQVKTA